MIALLQRVLSASVRVDGAVVGAIGDGLLVFMGYEHGDEPMVARTLVERIVHYRVFGDDRGRMNRSLQDTGGAVLLVPQFTLCADTGTGRRPDFGPAAGPDVAAGLFAASEQAFAALGIVLASGRFGADMQVALVNDGPVTFILRAGRDGSGHR